jgi:hypothetical protein
VGLHVINSLLGNIKVLNALIEFEYLIVNLIRLGLQYLRELVKQSDETAWSDVNSSLLLNVVYLGLFGYRVVDLSEHVRYFVQDWQCLVSK